MNKYQHYKTGNMYYLIGEVLCLKEEDCDHLYYTVLPQARHSETLAMCSVLKEQKLGFMFIKCEEVAEPLVLYKALYGEHGFWLRPKQMFFENVAFNGKSVKRFEHVHDVL